MKHTAAIMTAVFIFTTALGTASFAQGRHDDKAHGTPKIMPMATESQAAAAPAGRHDERPHGPKKAVAKKAGDKPTADKAGAVK
jgi:hypothetical protein